MDTTKLTWKGLIEILGILGVIGSLIFVALEIRQNTNALRSATIQAIGELLSDLAAERPVIHIFEDAHWADPTSLEVLDQLIGRISSLPVLEIITFRPEFAPPWRGHANVTALALNRLGKYQCADMVARVTGG